MIYSHIQIHTLMCMRLNAYVHAHTFTYKHIICMYMHTQAHHMTHTCTYMHVHVYALTYACTGIHIGTHLHTCADTHVCTFTCTCMHRMYTHRHTCTVCMSCGSSYLHYCIASLDPLAAATAVNAVLATSKSRPKPLTAKQRLGKIMRLGKNWKK